MFDKNTNFLIIGLGLIGGSYAKALIKKGYNVYALARRKETIDYAKKNNIITDGSIELDAKMISKADIIIFALYPKAFKEWIINNQHLFKNNALITDVTGVKSCIVYDIQNILREDLEFIAAHPMAGKEVSGVENADENIFKEANYIVTPTNKNTNLAIQKCKALGELLNFKRISTLSIEEHDEIIAYLSQLTHCIAIALMTEKENKEYINYTGDSFRDLTRIAKINEDMWSELFIMNKDKLINNIESFINELDKIKEYIIDENREKLKEIMRLSTSRRKLFDKSIKEEKNEL